MSSHIFVWTGLVFEHLEHLFPHTCSTLFDSGAHPAAEHSYQSVTSHQGNTGCRSYKKTNNFELIKKIWRQFDAYRTKEKHLLQIIN